MLKRMVKMAVGIGLSIIISLGILLYGGNVGGLNIEAHSETFTGYVSNAEYTAEEDAAKAFVEKELVGTTRNATYVGYEKVKDLSSEEIDEITQDQQLDESVVSVQEVSVYYSENGATPINNSPLSAGNKEFGGIMIRAYLFKMQSGNYRYFVPLQDDGEALTNSYFETVFDGKKYLNSTSTTVFLINFQGTSAINTSYTQTIKLADTKAHFNQSLMGLSSDYYFAEREGETLEIYLKHPKRNDGKFYTLTQINNESSSVNYSFQLMRGNEKVIASNFTMLEQVAEFIFVMDLDASYFVKTSYGFEMTEDKYGGVVELLMGNSVEQVWTDYEISFGAKYYVSQGRLSASKTTLVMNNGKDFISINVTTNYSNFGSTTVTLPVTEVE